ncbi:uncharacterized protein [Amphiura filiformis]|uniref:uncharacterized protein n=1 Tax=Amphiura filiformis TaxID=82378 RepID=UPI003B20D317
MAAYAVIGILCIISSFPLCSEAAETRVEVTIPVQPVINGGVLAIQCQVWKMQGTYTANFFRVLNEHTEQLTFVENQQYIQSSLGSRSFMATRSFSDGSFVLFLTLVDVSHSDQGEYLCKVYSWNKGNFVDIARDSRVVTISSFPNEIYPTCTSEPDVVTVNNGERLTFTCISEKGSPSVQLKWNCVNKHNIYLHNRTITNIDTVSSTMIFTAEPIHHGAIFQCTMTSTEFPGRQRSCTIGPLNIQSSIRTNLDKSPKTDIRTVKGQVIQNESPLTGENCNNSCPHVDQFALLYWSVAMVGTTILMFIFLTTTIIWCYKYHNIYRASITAQRSVTYTSGDVTEPVYVSLQSRPDPDRNSTYSTYMSRVGPDRSSTYSSYMTVEDPGNPGNKVVMPKEIFDEFYSSLSLKKHDSRP